VTPAGAAGETVAVGGGVSAVVAGGPDVTVAARVGLGAAGAAPPKLDGAQALVRTIMTSSQASAGPRRRAVVPTTRAWFS
jgi:hypothetical protein